MKIKNFKDWQHYNEELLINEAYKSISNDFKQLFEALTSGERAAATRDFNILSDSQLAGMYLRALGSFEEDANKYINLIITDDAGLDVNDFADSTGKWTIPGLGDALDIKTTTLTRTANKFKNMLADVWETETEVLYPKVIEAFEKFKNMNPSAIGAIAGEALQASGSTFNRDKEASAYDANRQKRLTPKKEDGIIAQTVYQLANKLKEHFNKEKALLLAINKISKESGMDVLKIEEIFNKFLRTDKLNY